MLANAYVDLGTWSNITPYVGVGAGVSFHRASAPVVPDAAQTKFAWAVMAGIGFGISENIKLDIGYRYVNLGRASGLLGAAPFRKNYDVHEARIGVRYLID